MKRKKLFLKIKASSLLETVLAMVIIAIMLIVGSQTYSVVTRSKSTLQEINEQGQFYTRLLKEVYLKNQQEVSWEGTYTSPYKLELETDAYILIQLKSERGKSLGSYVIYPNSVKFTP